MESDGILLDRNIHEASCSPDAPYVTHIQQLSQNEAENYIKSFFFFSPQTKLCDTSRMNELMIKKMNSLHFQGNQSAGAQI